MLILKDSIFFWLTLPQFFPFCKVQGQSRLVNMAVPHNILRPRDLKRLYNCFLIAATKIRNIHQCCIISSCRWTWICRVFLQFFKHCSNQFWPEDVTNSQLRKMGPVKRTQALFDSPTDARWPICRKTAWVLVGISLWWCYRKMMVSHVT